MGCKNTKITFVFMYLAIQHIYTINDYKNYFNLLLLFKVAYTVKIDCKITYSKITQ